MLSLYLGFEPLSPSQESSNQSTLPHRRKEIVTKPQCGFTQFSPRENCFFLFWLNALVRAQFFTNQFEICFLGREWPIFVSQFLGNKCPIFLQLNFYAIFLQNFFCKSVQFLSRYIFPKNLPFSLENFLAKSVQFLSSSF